MTAVDHPFDWHLHLVWFLAVALFVGAYLRATRTVERRPTTRQYVLFGLGTLILLLAVTWPLGDLAAHWSLLSLVLQRLLLMLAVPPLLVLGTPVTVIASVTRPAPIDALVRIAVRPIPAVAIVTVIAVGTLTTGAVSLAANSALARAALQVLVLLAGFVLWAPVLSQFPGTRHLSALAKGGYLIVQSIVPSFLSVVWIFARRPLYPAYSHHVFAGMSPLLDQQLAGFLAKLSTIAVLWTVAFITMSRAKVVDGAEGDDEPLVWRDVQREIERAERRDRWGRWLPPSSGDPG
ncbi:MAG: cytochrome c oxidase assembly protein [Acidimicrobiales bacterium]